MKAGIPVLGSSSRQILRLVWKSGASRLARLMTSPATESRLRQELTLHLGDSSKDSSGGRKFYAKAFKLFAKLAVVVPKTNDIRATGQETCPHFHVLWKRLKRYR
jgi:hypothetical protein